MVLTDEGNLWYSTNIRQFPAPPDPEGGSEADGELPVHPPLRRVRGESSIVELAGGVGQYQGLRELADDEASASSGDVVSSDSYLESIEAISGSGSKPRTPQAGESLAATYLREKRFSMEDCLEVLEGERFRKTRKKRAIAWQDHQPPSVHTTLRAYQRGP